MTALEAFAQDYETEDTDYWAPEDHISCEAAHRAEELGEVALGVLYRLPEPAELVCGPITSGGKSLAENLRVFRLTIDRLRERGHVVMDQLPLERHIVRILPERTVETNLLILNGVYGPMLRSGRIRRLNFIHGWDASFGASWEHNEGTLLGILRQYLPADFLEIWP